MAACGPDCSLLGAVSKDHGNETSRKRTETRATYTPKHIAPISPAVRKEKLGDFEQNAKRATAHGGSKCSFEFTVAGVQTEKTKDTEQQSRESSKDGKVSKIGISIGPLPQPSRNPNHLAHVRRRSERTDRNRCEKCEQQREKYQTDALRHRLIRPSEGS